MMKKILIIAPKYSGSRKDPYLTNDLANELVGQNFHVTVIGLGQQNFSFENDSLSEKVICISSSVKYIKYFFTWFSLAIEILTLVFARTPFHRVLMFAPLTVMWPAAICIKLLKSKKNIVFIFDIFPIHQVKIGAIPSWISKILKIIETYFLRSFDMVIAMGEENRKYIKNYYFKKIFDPIVSEVNLWSSNIHNNKPAPCTKGITKIIFGGQIIKGRRPDILIDFIERLNLKNANLVLDIYSSGHEFDRLKKTYAHLTWLRFLSPVSRDIYREILKKYHVGSLVTDSSSDLPTFPSKVIDYISAGLYVFGIVEQKSDLFNVFREFSRIHLNSFDQSECAINKALLFFENVKKESFTNEIGPLNDIFDIKRVTERILN